MLPQTVSIQLQVSSAVGWAPSTQSLGGPGRESIPTIAKWAFSMDHVQPLERVGRWVVEYLQLVGGLAMLLVRTVHWVARGALEPRQTVLQMARVGVESLPLILFTGIFAGMVLAFQTALQLIRIGLGSFVGGAVAVSLAREAAPVFTAVTMAGRIGAGFAAEIGTMAVTEQIDALRVLATDPVRFLVVPRATAGIFMLPLLTIFANLAGLLGGFLVAAGFGVGVETYASSILRFLTAHDYVSGLVKAAFFGGIIAFIATYRGLATQGGAEGVGRAATSAVTTAIVLILVSDYFLDLFLY